MPVILALGGGLTENQEFKVTFSSATEFKANLGRERPCLKKKNLKTKQSWRATATTVSYYRKMISSALRGHGVL